MMQALKFQRQWSLGPALGIVIGQRRGNAILDCALEMAHQRPCEKSIHRPYLTKNRPTIQLCAIPLSAHRMIERGFNQSELILNGLRDSLEQNPLARHLVIQRKNVLARRRDTVAQTLIEPSMREQNLKNAFDVRGSCENQIIVLVDDVMTSGATLASAAQTLKSAGALAVINAVAARTA